MDAQVNFDWRHTAPDPLATPGSDFSVQWKGLLVSPISGRYQLVVTADDGVRLLLDRKVLVDAPVTSAPNDPANLAKPSKSYTASVYLQAGQKYALQMEYFAQGGSVVHLEWLTPALSAEQSFAREVDAARNSDLVIAFLGFGSESGMEGKDRDNLDLANDQQQLIRQVVAANPKTIVVLVSGGPLAVDWISNHVPALVEAWYPGEQGGSAIASLLLGEMNPAGRLPLTFYRSADQLPGFKDYEISHGKTYQYFRGKPLYPFGYGLSYSRFTYSNLRLTPGIAKTGEVIDARFDITNTGSWDGDEVAQLYFHSVDPLSTGPIRRLAAFRRVTIRKGETITLSLPLRVESLRVYNSQTKRLDLLSGKIAIEVGSSSADIRLSNTLTRNKLPEEGVIAHLRTPE